MLNLTYLCTHDSFLLLYLYLCLYDYACTQNWYFCLDSFFSSSIYSCWLGKRFMGASLIYPNISIYSSQLITFIIIIIITINIRSWPTSSSDMSFLWSLQTSSFPEQNMKKKVKVEHLPNFSFSFWCFVSGWKGFGLVNGHYDHQSPLHHNPQNPHYLYVHHPHLSGKLFIIFTIHLAWWWWGWASERQRQHN